MSVQPVPSDLGPAPRWGEQTSFFQRHQAAFWVFLLILGLTGLDFLAQQLQMIAAEPAAWMATILLLVPYAVPVIAVIYLLDLYEREPASIMVAALLWGGIAATSLSMYTNTPLMEVVFKLTGSVQFTTEWSAALTAPFVEELYKGLGIVLLVAIARRELDDILDGFVWGAMVGIGFLLVEDVFYFMNAVAETGSIGALVPMFLIRIVGAGPYSHFLYTGLVGMGIAYVLVRADRPTGERYLKGALLVAAGVGAHFVWNSPILSTLLGDGSSIVGWAMYTTLKGLPMLVGLVLVVRLARQRERRWFASLSSGFHDDGSITGDELAELGGLRARRRARNAAGARFGPKGKLLQGRLQHEQLQLAMAFSRHGSEDHPDVRARMGAIAGLRTELVALGAGVAAPAATGGWSAVGTAGQGAATAAAAPTTWGRPATQASPASRASSAQPAPAVQPAPESAAPVSWGEPAPAAQPAPVPQPAPIAQPAPVVQPAPPPVLPQAPAWMPTHLAPDGGLPAWSAPDPALAPVVTLDARLELAVAERAGDWARVVAVNGWTGWVDARRLLSKG